MMRKTIVALSLPVMVLTGAGVASADTVGDRQQQEQNVGMGALLGAPAGTVTGAVVGAVLGCAAGVATATLPVVTIPLAPATCLGGAALGAGIGATIGGGAGALGGAGLGSLVPPQ